MSGYYFFVGSNLEKIWKILEKRPFLWADMAGLGKYSMGGYGRIGVYRDNTLRDSFISVNPLYSSCMTNHLKVT